MQHGGQGIAADLRRALDKVRRTAQAHISAVQETEKLLADYEAQVAQDQRTLADEREELMQEKAAFEEERRGMKWGGQDQDLQEGDAALVGEEAMAEGGDEGLREFEEPPMDGEAPAGSGGGWLFPKSAGGRAASRSRSPRAMAPLEAEVAERAKQMRLDENATRQLQAFDPAEALRMLDQVPDSVRNPSAFITKMCQRAMTAPAEAVSESSEVVEAAVRELGLDESSARSLRELPLESALSIIDQVPKGVRNPSAFVMSLVHRGAKGAGRELHRMATHDDVRDRCTQMSLDGSAFRMLSELSPDHAMSILDQVSDDVRNPSAFVTAEARKALPAGGSKGGSSGGGSLAPVPPQFASQIEAVARGLQLDATCVDALREVDPQDALNILEKLSSDFATIRNRSAFVFAEVNKRKRPSGGGRDAAPSRGGARAPCSSVPCKFFAKGMCKNGAECRFSHV